jgi:hypothetical protein
MATQTVRPKSFSFCGSRQASSDKQQQPPALHPHAHHSSSTLAHSSTKRLAHSHTAPTHAQPLRRTRALAPPPPHSAAAPAQPQPCPSPSVKERVRGAETNDAHWRDASCSAAAGA